MAEIASILRSFGNTESLPTLDNSKYAPRLAIYGTSSDPPHNGHSSVIKALVESGSYDEIWVLPVYVHMFSAKASSLSPFEHRMAMCSLCFSHLGSTQCAVKVLPLEKLVYDAALVVNKGEPMRVGSALILDIIHLLYPGTVGNTTFVVGTDTFMDLLKGKWKDAAKILRENGIAVAERGSPPPAAAAAAAAAAASSEYSESDKLRHDRDDVISSSIATCSIVEPRTLSVSRFISSGGFEHASSSAVRSLVDKVFHARLQDTIIRHDRQTKEQEQQQQQQQRGKGAASVMAFEQELDVELEGELESMVSEPVLQYIRETGLYVRITLGSGEGEEVDV